MTSSCADRLTRTVRLADGRDLCYADLGLAEGRPVLFFHGGLQCRLVTNPDPQVARDAGLRLIAVDRPGFGRSDFKPGRRLIDWAQDVNELADALQLNELTIVGWSAGGPHALACACGLPGRVIRAVVVSGAGNLEEPGAIRQIRAPTIRRTTWLARRASPLNWMAISALGRRARRDPAALVPRLFAGARTAPPSDREVVARPEVRRHLEEGLREAFHAGARGPAWDARLISRPWGFDVGEISSTVLLFHGTEDDVAPVGMARELERALPDAELRTFPGAGHFLLFDCWREILAVS